MDAHEAIDIDFDFRTDADGKDPDSNSPTLRRYHRLLWSKPLPSGDVFELDDATPGVYLYHRSDELGEFFLTSDALIPTFRYAAMVQKEEEELREFLYIGYTIGGMMLFPGNQVD